MAMQQYDEALYERYIRLLRFSMMELEDIDYERHRYLVIDADTFRQDVVERYFDEFPERTVIPTDAELMNKHAELIEQSNKHFELYALSAIRQGIIEFKKLDALIKSMPLPRGNTTKDWAKLNDKSTSTYSTQGLSASNYTRASFVGAIHKLEQCNIDVKLEAIFYEYFTNIELWAKCTPMDWVIIQSNVVNTLESIAAKYKEQLNMGVNPKVLLFGTDHKFIDFVREHLELTVDEICLEWRGRA